MSDNEYLGYFEIRRDMQAGRALLVTEEAAKAYSFPAEMSDEAIREAVKFANVAYGDGVRWGSARRAAEIREALGVHESIADMEKRLSRKLDRPSDSMVLMS